MAKGTSLTEKEDLLDFLSPSSFKALKWIKGHHNEFAGHICGSVMLEARSGRPEWMNVEDTKQLQRQKQLDCVEAERMRMDKKAELRCLERRLQMERTEANMEEALKKEKIKAMQLEAEREEAEKIATEMKILEQESLKEMKLRQQLRESSEELKTLEARLRAAYVSKELAAQIAEKKAADLQDKLDKKKIQEAWEAEQRCMEKEELKKKQESMASRLNYRLELQDQIISAYKRQQDAYQEFIKEKQLLDQIVRAIHEEDQREEELRMEQMQRTRQEIETFRAQQEIWKQRERLALELEDRRIKEYVEQCERKEKKKIQEIKEKEEMKRKLTDKLHASLLSKQEEQEERHQVLAELAAEEVKERELERVKADIAAAVRRREELQRTYKVQLAERRQRLQDEEGQQEMYRQQLLAQFAEDERLEQLTAERRRLKVLEHRRQVQQLLEEKHKRRVEEWQELAALERLQAAEERQRGQLIEEERLRMLKKHASKLLGHLPRGVLREDDLTHLGSDFLEEFNKYKAMNETANVL